MKINIGLARLIRWLLRVKASRAMKHWSAEADLERLERSELVQVSIADQGDFNSWVKYAGLWKDHRDFDAFVENIAEYRQAPEDVRLTR